MKAVGFHHLASEEIVAAGERYTKESPVLGGRFYDEIREVVNEIRRRPTLFRIFDPPCRRHFGDTFPYAVIYLNEPDRIWIVAVAHFKQRPGYWKDRLP